MAGPPFSPCLPNGSGQGGVVRVALALSPSWRAEAPAVGSSGFLDPKHLPTLAFVSPDLCDDTHDCPVATGDDYLKTLLTPILTSSTYRAGKTAIIVVYDEYTPLPNVLISRSVRPGTITAPVTYNLLLHTVESMLGVPWLVGTGDLRAASGL